MEMPPIGWRRARRASRLDPEHKGLPAIVGGGGASGAIESWRECYNDNIDDSGNFVNTC